MLEQNSSVLPRNTKVVAKIKLKQSKEPTVMYLLPGSENIGDLDDALAMAKIKS